MSLTPEQIEAGWVEHDGSRVPRSVYGKTPEVLTRSGLTGWMSWMANAWVWKDSIEYLSDIIAYRPEPKP